MDLGLNLENTHVIVTGGSGYIGSVTVSAFLTAGAYVTSLDIKPPPKETLSEPNFQFVLCDISSETAIEASFKIANQKWGLVQCCIALASLDLSVLEHHESMADISVEQWRRTHQVNVEGTFLTARTFLRQLRENASQGIRVQEMKNISLIIVGSESGTFGERGNADYAAGKSAVQGGLLKSLAGDITRICPKGRYLPTVIIDFAADDM